MELEKNESESGSEWSESALENEDMKSDRLDEVNENDYGNHGKNLVMVMKLLGKLVKKLMSKSEEPWDLTEPIGKSLQVFASKVGPSKVHPVFMSHIFSLHQVCWPFALRKKVW